MKLTKSYYKIGEVSAMLDVPVTTLRWWERQFDALRPQKTPTGHRRYTLADIEVVKRIVELLRVKGLTLEGAKATLDGYEPKQQLHAPDPCKSIKGAIRLLTEASKRIDDPSTKVRVESVLEWLKTSKTDSQI